VAREFTIGTLATATGTPVSTIRYYERIGILEARKRSNSNYRLYGEREQELLQFVNASKSLGFKLEHIKLLLELREDPAPPQPQIEKLLENRLSELEQQLGHLREVQDLIRSALERCRGGNGCGECAILDQLNIEAAEISGKSA